MKEVAGRPESMGIRMRESRTTVDCIEFAAFDSREPAGDYGLAMTEHGFLALMLAIVASEVVVLGLGLGYFTYRIHQILERAEGVGAATFLEVRKILGQSR